MKLFELVKETTGLVGDVVVHKLPKTVGVLKANGGVVATAKKTIGAVVSNTADNLDAHIQVWVEDFVVYMDAHPGFSAVIAPSSVTRRLAYRHTEELMNKNRQVIQEETPVL